MRCIRCDVAMDEIYSPQGVLVDFCPRCKGMWLDKGELNHFLKDPAQFAQGFRGELLNPQAVESPCPRCGSPLRKGGLLVEELEVEQCSRCQGFWFDADEVRRLNEVFQKLSKRPVSMQAEPGWAFAMPAAPGGMAAAAAAPGAVAAVIPLPNLALRSLATLSLLYVLLAVVLFAAAEYYGLSLGIAIFLALALLAVQFLISPWLMDWSLRWFQSMHWASWDELSHAVKASAGRICWQHKIPIPRLGIIEDGNPNAFTYGHTPRNARLIVTRGLLEVLDENELDAVVAHEVGHAVHYDILVMTAAAAVPAILYMIYRVLTPRRGSRNRGGAAQIALLALILYYVSEYIVLFLSRAREYYADRFSAEATHKPNALAVALTKIAYGLAGRKTEAKEEEEERAAPRRGFARALGIFDPLAARALVATTLGQGQLSTENMLAAMQWDLWNPWARYYEFHSSHPLPAKRIQALGQLAQHQGQTPVVNFNLRQPESYWDEFATDLGVMFLPLAGWLAALAFWAGAATGSGGHRLAGLVFPGLGWLVKILYEYRGRHFPDFTVSGLLKKVKVSRVRPVPCRLRGTIIGRGIPGLIWSEDMVLQDDTGYVFLDYRQPLAVFEWLFGLFRTPGIIGQEVDVEGWYRRSPVPFVEMKTLRVGGTIHRAYVYPLKLCTAAALLLVGLCGIFV